MTTGTLKAMIAALDKLVQALANEVKPTPTPTPPAPVRPGPDHASYIKADMTMCCDFHDRDFVRRSAQVARGVLDFTVPPREHPGLTHQMREYIQQRLGNRRA
jgi:hypothetical protein